MAALILLVVFIGILKEPKPTQAQERMGCFTFTNSQPVLSENTYTRGDSSTMTIYKCIDRCQLRGKTYAGIRFGYICWCGDNHHHTVNGPQLSDSECTTACVGDHWRLCGGQNSIVIFAVCSRGRYNNITNDKPNCDGRCHCLENSICPYFNGLCVAGCDPGWSGAPCNVPACVYVSEEGCALPCNCANNVACDEETGACRDGCRDGRPRPPGNETVFDWRGAGCKIGNIAYRKSASQSGTYRGWNAGNAVDGRLPPPSLTDLELQEKYCSHTDAPEASLAWWSVDLAGLHQIDNITLFNRYYSNWHRTSNLNVTISNSSDFIDAAVCAFYLGPLPNGGNVTLSCESRLVGRYVKLQRTGGIETNIINVCEVVVMGYEVVVEDVSKCLNPSVGSASIVGCMECSGFEPPHCTIPCNAGSYGINCASSCINHHCTGSHLVCDHVTGECPNGCENSYIGDKCIEHMTSTTAGMVSQTLTSTTEQRKPDTSVSTVSTQSATAQDDDSREYMITLFAALFGISAVINIGVIFICIRSKIEVRRAKPPTVQSEGAPNTDATYYNASARYEGLGPVSRAPEGPYDELHMEENHVTAEPEYEKMA